MKGETVEQMFERLTPALQASLDYTGIRTHTVEDVKAAVEAGLMHFWPVKDSVVITELSTYPQGKVLNIFIGGGNADDLMEVLEPLRAWGKTLGCSHVSFLGRKGWNKLLTARGWTDHRMSFFSAPTGFGRDEQKQQADGNE